MGTTKTKGKGKKTMSNLDERLGWLLIGVAIGYGLGQLVRAVEGVWSSRNIAGPNQLAFIKMRPALHRNEAGFLKYRAVANITLVSVLVLSVWASWASQRASNDVLKTQERIDTSSKCTLMILEKTIDALNERTQYSTSSTRANVDVQRAQAVMLEILLHKPPFTSQEEEAAQQTYFAALSNFLTLTDKQKLKTDEYSYPTVQELQSCLDRH